MRRRWKKLCSRKLNIAIFFHVGKPRKKKKKVSQTDLKTLEEEGEEEEWEEDEEEEEKKKKRKECRLMSDLPPEPAQLFSPVSLN